MLKMEIRYREKKRRSNFLVFFSIFYYKNISCRWIGAKIMIGEPRTRHMAHNCSRHCSAGVTMTSAQASPGWSSGQPVLLGPTILPGPASTAGNDFLPQTPPPPSPPPRPLAGNALIDGSNGMEDIENCKTRNENSQTPVR
ncbi:unnamed protein product [Prunus armeniaca]